MNLSSIAALISPATKAKTISILDYIQRNPHRIDVLIVIIQGDFGTPSDLLAMCTAEELGLISALQEAIAADVEAPAFMRTVMKAVMSGGMF